MICRGIQRVFCGAHPTQGLGALVTNVGRSQINGRDGRIDLQSLGQRLEAATDQGWRLDFRALPAKPHHLNPTNNWHSTETYRMSMKFSDLRLVNTLQKSSEIHTSIQHLCSTTLLDQR